MSLWLAADNPSCCITSCSRHIFFFSSEKKNQKKHLQFIVSATLMWVYCSGKLLLCKRVNPPAAHLLKCRYICIIEGGVAFLSACIIHGAVAATLSLAVKNTWDAAAASPGRWKDKGDGGPGATKTRRQGKGRICCGGSHVTRLKILTNKTEYLIVMTLS